MPVIERSITLNLPVEAAFRYLIDPTHLPEFCPNMDAISSVEQINSCCIHFQWKCRMNGVHFEGRAEIKDTQHPHRADVSFWGGIIGTAVWTTQQLKAGVLLTITVDYTLPAPLLRKHRAEDIIHHNEQSVETMLEKLKSELESKVAVEPAG